MGFIRAKTDMIAKSGTIKAGRIIYSLFDGGRYFDLLNPEIQIPEEEVTIKSPGSYCHPEIKHAEDGFDYWDCVSEGDIEMLLGREVLTEELFQRWNEVFKNRDSMMMLEDIGHIYVLFKMPGYGAPASGFHMKEWEKK